MADSTADLATSRYDGELVAYPVVKSLAIPKGVMAFINTDAAGYLTSTVSDASASNLRFAGITAESCDAQDASGNVKLKVWKKGAFELALTGAALTSAEAAMYLVDNQTVTATDTGSLIKIGTAVKYENSSKVFVDIERR